MIKLSLKRKQQTINIYAVAVILDAGDVGLVAGKNAFFSN